MAIDASFAHSTMRGGANPSDLQVAEQSYGGSKCHSGAVQLQRDHIHRVTKSIQATCAGAFAAIRFTFGAQPDLIDSKGIDKVQKPDFQLGNPGVQSLQPFYPDKKTNQSVLKFTANCF